ncbi:tail assembly chaperone [Gordonia phage Hedwig]|uniref:Tail assembly chaperone n=1 Tax=Gordonia phage Hedwig TaxID=1887648 RepID=A0A1C9EHR2_9CAUD|nr:tail assembly chaperone [Gordonia phage Hedwig]AON97308.1 tail assembly chaperone [Gordonia phage Hedwig]
MIDEDFDQFEDGDDAAPTTTSTSRKSTSKRPAKKTTTAKRPAKKAAAPRARRPEPASDPEPQDDEPSVAPGLPETAARQREGRDDELVRVTQNGVPIEVPADQGQWPLSAMEYLITGRIFAGVRLLVGEEQWSALIASGAKVRDANELFDKIAAELGLESAGK